MWYVLYPFSTSKKSSLLATLKSFGFYSAELLLRAQIFTKTRRTWTLRARAGAAAKSAAIKYDLSFFSLWSSVEKHLLPPTRALGFLVWTKHNLSKFSWRFPLPSSLPLIYWVLFHPHATLHLTMWRDWSTFFFFFKAAHYFHFAAAWRSSRDGEAFGSSKVLAEDITCIFARSEHRPGRE